MLYNVTMATTEDIVRPKVCTKERKYEKSNGTSRLCLLVFCFTIIINKGFLSVDALEHRHRGEFCQPAQPAECIFESTRLHSDIIRLLFIQIYVLELFTQPSSSPFALIFLFDALKPNSIKWNSCLTRKVYLNETNINSSRRHPKSRIRERKKIHVARHTIIWDFIFILIPFGEVFCAVV